MEGKRIRESTIIMAQLMNPQDANPAGNVHGGVIMRLIDNAAGCAAVAIRGPMSLRPPLTGLTSTIQFCRRPRDRKGQLKLCRKNVNGTRCPGGGGKSHHRSEAPYGIRVFNFCGLDSNGRPLLLSPLVVETNEEKRRNQEARNRRKTRLAEKTKEKQCQADMNCIV